MTNKLSNKEIAELLKHLAQYKELSGANPFSIRAIDNAAKFMQTFAGNPLTEKMDSHKGIGKKMAEMIVEGARTGRLSELERYKSQYPDVLDLTKVAGIGMKRALLLNERFGVSTRVQLLELLQQRKIVDPKMLKAVEFSMTANARTPRYMVERRLEPLLKELEGMCIRMEVVGSLRRKSATVKDVDILAVTEDRNALMTKFSTFGNVLSAGDDRSSIQFDGGAVKFQIDLLCVEMDSWGAALNYFTGSKEHNVALRGLAKSAGLTVNEKGIFDSLGRKVGGAEESDLYNILGVAYTPPEFREGPHLYPVGKLPQLISWEDIKIDMHCHTTFSDGNNTIEEMVENACRLGLKEIGISDHVANAVYGNKLTERGTQLAWGEEINRVAKIYAPSLVIYRGAEVDINVAGELQVPEGLDELDYLIASAHTQPGSNLTERFLNAIRHPKVKVLGHPTGREFGKRPEGEADWDKVFAACKEHGVAIEVNGIPQRMDLPDNLAHRAIKMGCKLILNSDAHNIGHVKQNLRYALEIARRAGAARKDIILSMSELLGGKYND